MDEEDIRDAEEDRTLSTVDEFASLGSTAEDSKRLGGILDLFRTTGETIGVKLLKRMGWKEGQGIGPRVRRTAFTTSEDDTREGAYSFAASDPDMISLSRKADHKGLGYDGEAPLSSVSGKVPISGRSRKAENDSDDESTMSHSLFDKSRKTDQRRGRKGGFGVGVLNDTGSDEEDPYQIGPRIYYSRTLGGEKKSKKKDFGCATSNPRIKSNSLFVAQKSSSAKLGSSFRKCHDGRLPLEGFVLAGEMDPSAATTLQDERHKPPEIPPDWKSARTATMDLSTSRYVSVADAAKLSSLNAKSRATMLGETQLPGKSVFDFLTPAARNKIVAVSGRDDLPPALNEAAPKASGKPDSHEYESLRGLVPPTGTEDALKAPRVGFRGWMPYAEDEHKRLRYHAYLEGRAGLQDSFPARPANMSKEAWAIELQEFAHAAQATNLMASRFTSSSTSQPQATSQPSSPSSSLLGYPASKAADTAEAAARMGMFGPMTRSVQNFYPTRLLCKRFNVQPPVNGNLDSEHRPGKAGTAGVANMSRFQSAGYQTSSDSHAQLLPKSFSDHLATASVAGTSLNTDAHDIDQQEKKTVVDAGCNDALEADRPGQAVFKAIFDSESSVEEND